MPSCALDWAFVMLLTAKGKLLTKKPLAIGRNEGLVALPWELSQAEHLELWWHLGAAKNPVAPTSSNRVAFRSALWGSSKTLKELDAGPEGGEYDYESMVSVRTN